MLVKSPNPLAEQVAAIAAEMRAMAHAHALREGVIAALQAMIAAALARLVGRLEDMLQLWQAGLLPPPGTLPPRPVPLRPVPMRPLPMRPVPMRPASATGRRTPQVPPRPATRVARCPVARMPLERRACAPGQRPPGATNHIVSRQTRSAAAPKRHHAGTRAAMSQKPAFCARLACA